MNNKCEKTCFLHICKNEGADCVRLHGNHGPLFSLELSKIPLPSKFKISFCKVWFVSDLKTGFLVNFSLDLVCSPNDINEKHFEITLLSLSIMPNSKRS